MKPLAELINLYIIRNENGFVKHFQEKNPKNNKKMCFSLGFKKESEARIFCAFPDSPGQPVRGHIKGFERAIFPVNE